MNKKVNRSFYLQFGKGEINGYVVKAEKLENSLEELYDWRTDVLRLADFDYIIIETVGVGQIEIDIAGLADVTVVTLVPESGDERQAMKSGIMEIADVFVVNKTDRPGADTFVRNLKAILMPNSQEEKMIPVVKIIATKNIGIAELIAQI